MLPLEGATGRAPGSPSGGRELRPIELPPTASDAEPFDGSVGESAQPSGPGRWSTRYSDSVNGRSRGLSSRSETLRRSPGAPAPRLSGGALPSVSGGSTRGLGPSAAAPPSGSLGAGRSSIGAGVGAKDRYAAAKRGPLSPSTGAERHPGAPRRLHNARVHSARVTNARVSAASAASTLGTIGPSTSPAVATKAFGRAVLAGGFAVPPAIASSTFITCGVSWYNFLNLGCSPWAPWNPFWACHSTFAFGFGFNWCNSWGLFHFSWGNPYWWWWPASYYSPFYSYPTYVPVTYPVYVPATTYVPYPVYLPAAEAEVVPDDAPAAVREEPALREMDTPRAPRSASAALADRYVTLGDLYFRVGRYDRAAESYRRAVDLDPADANLRFILSDALFAVGRYAEAADAIRDAILLDAGLVESRADKRSFYAVAGDFDAHMVAITRWIETHPTDADAWLVLGYNRVFRGELDAARDALIQARDLASEQNRRAAELFLAAVEVRLGESASSSAPGSRVSR